MTTFAILFPGQGSQSLGMLSSMAKTFPLIIKTFSQASDALGYDLWALTQEGPVSELNKTWKTQPALLTASVAIWRVWQAEGGPSPFMVAGHSLGEYSALVCAGVLNLTETVKLVELRGKLMQAAAGEGSMSAIIGLDDETIVKICKQTAQNQVVSPANFNSRGQVVISGHKEAVERANIACIAAGARKVFPLSVSVPSHCALMRPAADKLLSELNKMVFKTSKFPVLNNADVKVENSPEHIREALVRQLYSPIPWVKSIQFMIQKGVGSFLELGAGNILSGLNKRIVHKVPAFSVNDAHSLAHALNYVSGKSVNKILKEDIYEI